MLRSVIVFVSHPWEACTLDAEAELGEDLVHLCCKLQRIMYHMHMQYYTLYKWHLSLHGIARVGTFRQVRAGKVVPKSAESTRHCSVRGSRRGSYHAQSATGGKGRPFTCVDDAPGRPLHEGALVRLRSALLPAKIAYGGFARPCQDRLTANWTLQDVPLKLPWCGQGNRPGHVGARKASVWGT